MSPQHSSLLSVVRFCHNSNPWKDSSLAPFFSGPPSDARSVQIGFLPPSVVEAVKRDTEACAKSTGGQPALCWSEDGRQFWVNAQLASAQARTEAINALAQYWRANKTFRNPLDGWRDELYAVYGPADPASSASTGRRPAFFNLERAACALFGVATFGVHATAYTPDYKIWVPRRAATKSTWPGYLDNSVAGGITAGDAPYESMVRECAEEAGLQEDLVRSCTKQTGVISYFYTTPEGWVQPEVEFTYDIALPADVVPHPVDGEAESFELLDVDACLASMRRGEWKANSALVLIDFLLRHGLLTYETLDCDYLALTCALHADLGLPGC